MQCLIGLDSIFLHFVSVFVTLLQVPPPPLNMFLSQSQLLCNHFAPPAALHKCNVNIFNNDLQLWGFFALDLKYAKINMPPLLPLQTQVFLVQKLYYFALFLSAF